MLFRVRRQCARSLGDSCVLALPCGAQRPRGANMSEQVCLEWHDQHVRANVSRIARSEGVFAVRLLVEHENDTVAIIVIAH